MDRDKTIATHLPLARWRAYVWSKGYKHLSEELRAVAEAALVMAVDRLDERKNPVPYLWKAIDKSIINYLREERRHKPKEPVEREHEYPPWRDVYRAELEEMLHLTVQERAVLQLRECNYTLEEIGEKIGRNTNTVHYILKRIQERYIRRFGHP